MKNLGIIFIAACAFVSCRQNENATNTLERQDQMIPGEVAYVPNGVFNEVPFDGNVIHLTKDDTKQVCIAQEITQRREDLVFNANRISTEYYLKKKNIEGEELQESLKELEGEQLFFVEFSEAQKQDLMKKYYAADMDKGVSYLSFSVQSDFKIINTQGDTIRPNYSIYERNYHVAPFERVLLSFSGVDPEEELELYYTDNLFQKGEMVFHFPSEEYLIKNTQQAL